MDTKYLKRVFIRILSALLSVGFVYYVLYQITGGFSIKTQTIVARFDSKDVAVSADAYIMRKETPIYSIYGGTINYYVSDGQKIAADALIADVYSSGAGGDISRQIISIDKRIQLLKNSNIGDNVAVGGTFVIDGNISAQLYGIREKIAGNQLDYAAQAKDDLLTLLNRRLLITTDKTSFNREIEALLRERAVIAASLTGLSQKVLAPISGYFYGGADGYENIFSSSKIDTLTVPQFKEMIESDPEFAILSHDGQYGVGKIADSHYWYIACIVNGRTLALYTAGREYSVVFPYSGNLALRMKLEHTLTEGDGQDALLIFSCAILPENFSFLRCQRVEISRFDTLSGLKIPASAIRILDGVSGVYIQYGNRVYFRIAEIVGEADGYCYINPDAEGHTLFEEDDIDGNEIYCGPLKQNDRVIVSGIELYHGKLIR